MQQTLYKGLNYLEGILPELKTSNGPTQSFRNISEGLAILVDSAKNRELFESYEDWSLLRDNILEGLDEVKTQYLQTGRKSFSGHHLMYLIKNECKKTEELFNQELGKS